MGTDITSNETKLFLGLGVLVVIWLVAAYIFRDSLGLVVFLILGVATLMQLIRVAMLGGKRKTLKELWSAFKDAFWGVG
jgi:hypothetical protein